MTLITPVLCVCGCKNMVYALRSKYTVCHVWNVCRTIIVFLYHLSVVMMETRREKKRWIILNSCEMLGASFICRPNFFRGEKTQANNIWRNKQSSGNHRFSCGLRNHLIHWIMKGVITTPSYTLYLLTETSEHKNMFYYSITTTRIL